MAQQQGSTKEKIRYQEPTKYTVTFHNDDFTPMDLVVMVLMNVFFKTFEDAYSLMMQVHNNGKAKVGSYTYDIAKSKAARAQQIARENGYPLKVTVDDNVPS